MTLAPNRVRLLALALIALVAAAALGAGTGRATAAPKAAKPKAQAGQTITDLVVASTKGNPAEFKTLLMLVKKAGLAKTLAGPGPFTVFAPTDKAFAKVPKSTLNKLLKNRKLLRSVLLYHVVSGKVMAADVVKLTKATTVNGKDIAIKVRNGSVYLNGKTRVIKTDIEASNGIVHVINKVLLPPA
jgi:uncharacterized surface protein with fasciclin (FAS1) repeats